MSSRKPKKPYQNKGGRKSAWTEKIEPRLDEIAAWCRDGLIDKQIAEMLNVGESTFDRYKRNKEQLRQALKVNKAIADLQVENALMQRALGYEYQEITEENNGAVKTVTKQMAPDVAAQIFWLKNRQPDKWRDKKHNEISAEQGKQLNIGINWIKSKDDDA